MASERKSSEPQPGGMTHDVDAGVTLQISVAPQDLPHAREILPHQLRQWGAQVDEVLFTLDLGPGGDREALGSQEQRVETERLLEDLCSQNAHARSAQVDYAIPAIHEVSRCFFGGNPVPHKDCYGKVVYPYFFGLLGARNRFVLHMDSDMLFGGGSQTWIAEARRLFGERPEVFSCSPLPGPPSNRPFRRPVAIGHAGSSARRALAESAVPFASQGLSGPAFRFARVSTRDFMIDRSVFDDRRVTVKTVRPRLRNLLAATAKGGIARGDPRALPAESSLSRVMADHGLIRVDFLGARPGMWSIHPPVRSARFYRALPDLIARVEQGDVPEQQRGNFDLNRSMLEPIGAPAGHAHTGWRKWVGR